MNGRQPGDASLDLSIDLQAELVSITERQHLNKVHWTIQLVRHALEHRPLHIDVRSTAGVLELRQDGDGLSADEHRLLLAVTGGREQTALSAERQEALVELEARFGVTLLSLLLTSSRAEISGRRSLVSESGRVSAGPPVPTPGYRVRVWRTGRSLRQETAELRFYCRHASVPITVNGRPLNAPVTLERAILERPFRAQDGDGRIGLPASGTMTRLRYYKRGVYFGVRQSLPQGGCPVEATFDSTLSEHEDNFTRSVETANRALRVARRQLYADLPALFPAMTPRERARVKDIVIGLGPDRLPSAAHSLPLFHTSTSAWRVSLKDLAQLAERVGHVPYLSRASGHDDELPLLDTAEVASVARLLGVPVRRALRFRPPKGVIATVRERLRALTGKEQKAAPARALPEEAIDDDTRALLEALEQERPDVRFIVTAGGAPVLEPGRVRCMYLPSSSLALRHAVARYRERPDEVDAIGAALLGA